MLDLGMQNFSRPVQGEHFQIGSWMKSGVGNSMENRPYLGNVKRYGQARLLL